MEKECPDIMKLGLLSVMNKEKASIRKQPNHVSFAHKSLQEFGASKFICNQLETTTDVKVDVTFTELFGKKY